MKKIKTGAGFNALTGPSVKSKEINLNKEQPGYLPRGKHDDLGKAGQAIKNADFGNTSKRIKIENDLYEHQAD